MTKPEPTAKVLFRIPREDGAADVETLWAYDLGNDQYRLDNSPFYAYSVSCGDDVYAPTDPDEGFPTFEKVLKKSGNRTIRIVLDQSAEPGNRGDAILKGLRELGCDYEGANRRYISVNLPPGIDLANVSAFLIGKGVQWEHADPSYDELHPQ